MRILIIGGVAAGMSAAARARRADKAAQIVVLEQTGTVSFGACGLPYYVGGWFEDPSWMTARSVEQLRESGIDVRLFHRALSVDAKARTVRVRDLESGSECDEPYDALMVASGARPICPPVGGIELGNVHTLTRLEDGEAIKNALASEACREVAIIGAGFIGLEAAEACRHLGKRVRILQLEERVLAQAFDREITELIEKELLAKGVELHLSEGLVSFIGEGGTLRALRTQAGEYPADLAIVAVGVRPATSFLEGSGIAMLPNGAIVTDHSGRTNLEGIFAAGDCAAIPLASDGSPAYLPLATGANKMGRVVGDCLAGRTARHPGSLGSACIKVMGIEAGRTGLSEADARRRGIEVRTSFIQDKDHANYWPGQSDIAVKLIYDPVSRKLLGGQVAGGQGAVLRADILAAAIAGGLSVDQLGMLDLCYAPPFARTWDALNVAGNVAK